MKDPVRGILFLFWVSFPPQFVGLFLIGEGGVMKNSCHSAVSFRSSVVAESNVSLFLIRMHSLRPMVSHAVFIASGIRLCFLISAWKWSHHLMTLISDPHSAKMRAHWAASMPSAICHMDLGLYTSSSWSAKPPEDTWIPNTLSLVFSAKVFCYHPYLCICCILFLPV